MTKKTDWTSYYERPFKTASFSRKITGRTIIRAIKRHLKESGICLTELGGANSAFLELLIARLKPDKYIIVDFNKPGLEKTRSRIKKNDTVVLCHKDILSDTLKSEESDLVLSVGLIEHFDQKGTAQAIKAHFDLLKPGGYAVITFPTPTFLYQAARYFAEKLGVWIFHDERPLMFKEVLDTAEKYGQVLDREIIWPIVFTQGLIVCRKVRVNR